MHAGGQQTNRRLWKAQALPAVTGLACPFSLPLPLAAQPFRVFQRQGMLVAHNARNLRPLVLDRAHARPHARRRRWSDGRPAKGAPSRRSRPRQQARPSPALTRPLGPHPRAGWPSRPCPAAGPRCVQLLHRAVQACGRCLREPRAPRHACTCKPARLHCRCTVHRLTSWLQVSACTSRSVHAPPPPEALCLCGQAPDAQLTAAAAQPAAQAASRAASGADRGPPALAQSGQPAQQAQQRGTARSARREREQGRQRQDGGSHQAQPGQVSIPGSRVRSACVGF